MCVVRFSYSGVWLAAVRQWKDQAVEPWAYLEVRKARDVDDVRWEMWVQASITIGASLWLVQESSGHCHEDDGPGWATLAAHATEHAESIKGKLSAIGIPVVRASVDEEYKPHG
jgi:hypothetical protein